MALPKQTKALVIFTPAAIASAAFAAALAALALIALTAHAAPPPPQGNNVSVPENGTMNVSDHVWAIVGFPNIGIIVGNRATLVVDTGLGPRNGAVAAREAAKLSKNPNQLLYLTTTHYHPEHASGEAGFPSSTILIRDAVQQKEIESDGMNMVKRFENNASMHDLLVPVTGFRAPYIVFDTEAALDLGGVTARLFWLGTAHTLGDELIYVEPDRTLLPGDVVMNHVLPNLPSPDARLDNWIKILDQLRAMPNRPHRPRPQRPRRCFHPRGGIRVPLHAAVPRARTQAPRQIGRRSRPGPPPRIQDEIP